MSFILHAQRNADVVAAFQRYREYLQIVRESFPCRALELACSDWYFSPTDHRCPHDSWLEHITVSEPSSGARHEQRTVSIRIRLRSAYHDGFIEFHYPQVFSYSLGANDATGGHKDWRY